MRIAGLTWSRFEIPFRSAFGSSTATLGRRSGLLLRLEVTDGRVGLGEASPLPSFNGDTLEAAERSLTEIAPGLVGRAPDGLATALRPGSPAARFAFETAALDLVGRTRGLRVADLLAASSAAGSVSVNATVGVAEASAAAEAAARAVADGLGCVKLKVGMAATPSAEAARVAAVRAAIGASATLRLDANGAWTVETAIETIRACEPHSVELVEQPVPADDLAGLARVRRSVGVPIAADESASDLASLEAILAAGAADLIVVKPTVVGGLRLAIEMIERARGAGLDAIVTTTLDAGIATAAALHVAAAARLSRACGLATASLLEHDLLERSLGIAQGVMPLPPGPGLGVAIDAVALSRFAAAPGAGAGTGSLRGQAPPAASAKAKA